MYARAFVEGRLTEEDLEHFRRESRRPQHGLSSYPHPWLMPNFWQFPTVSMGLGPITAIYQARFLRYLRDRGILDTSASRVWCFVGDGETDEPESLGALTLASREGLDNLTFVINCNLQRLDGPVRGNGKIIQELEAAFRGAGWNCIKVIWGTDWDELLKADVDGRLVKRMGEVVDGQYQKYSVETGALHSRTLFRRFARIAHHGGAPFGRAAPEDAPRRTRSAKGVRGVRCGNPSPGFADRDSRQDDQGLWTRRGGRRSQHDASRKEARCRRDACLPQPVRHSDRRRSDQGRAVLPVSRRQRGIPVPVRTPQGVRRSPPCAAPDRRAARGSRSSPLSKRRSKEAADARHPRRWPSARC